MIRMGERLKQNQLFALCLYITITKTHASPIPVTSSVEEPTFLIPSSISSAEPFNRSAFFAASNKSTDKSGLIFRFFNFFEASSTFNPSKEFTIL